MSCNCMPSALNIIKKLHQALAVHYYFSVSLAFFKRKTLCGLRVCILQPVKLENVNVSVAKITYV
jgi:hypothetical protein